MKVLVLDTETTGLPAPGKPSIYQTEKWPYIIQISFILYDVIIHEILEKFDLIIKIPDFVEISPKSYEIHNISKQHSQSIGVPIVHALQTLNTAINSSHLIVGHNISFDKQVIIVEFIRNNMRSNFPEKNTFCTMKNYKKFCNITFQRANMTSYIKFPTLCELYEILFNKKPTNLHNSYNDILVCLRCYIKKQYNIDILTESHTYYNEFVTHFETSALDFVTVYD